MGSVDRLAAAGRTIAFIDYSPPSLYGRPGRHSRMCRRERYVDDVQAEYERTKALGASFTMPPTKVTGSTIAMLNDPCGNLIQIVALDQWKARE
ncbi:MAG TPA: VOC family protein [Patescibacteria group bacterium]|nr:VOC family protein [Patescibacteria group bacterium]